MTLRDTPQVDMTDQQCPHDVEGHTSSRHDWQECPHDIEGHTSSRQDWPQCTHDIEGCTSCRHDWPEYPHDIDMTPQGEKPPPVSPLFCCQMAPPVCRRVTAALSGREADVQPKSEKVTENFWRTRRKLFNFIIFLPSDLCTTLNIQFQCR